MLYGYARLRMLHFVDPPPIFLRVPLYYLNRKNAGYGNNVSFR